MQVVADALPPTSTNSLSEQRPHFQNSRINISALLFKRTLLWNVDGRTRDTTDKNFNKMEPAQSNRKRFRVITCVLQTHSPWAKCVKKKHQVLVTWLRVGLQARFLEGQRFLKDELLQLLFGQVVQLHGQTERLLSHRLKSHRQKCFECPDECLLDDLNHLKDPFSNLDSSMSWFILKPLRYFSYTT